MLSRFCHLEKISVFASLKKKRKRQKEEKKEREKRKNIWVLCSYFPHFLRTLKKAMWNVKTKKRLLYIKHADEKIALENDRFLVIHGEQLKEESVTLQRNHSKQSVFALSNDWGSISPYLNRINSSSYGTFGIGIKIVRLNARFSLLTLFLPIWTTWKKKKKMKIQRKLLRVNEWILLEKCYLIRFVMWL